MSDYRRRAVIASEGGGGASAPDFSTATWADIQAYINEYGTEGFADQVGATRSVVLTDTTWHTLRLANVTGDLYELSDGSGYTGMIVEFADIINMSKFVEDGSDFVAPLNLIDPIGTTTLPAIEALLPQEIQKVIANVKVITVTSSLNATLVSSDMRLFIPSENEIFGNTQHGYTHSAEYNISARWANYATNDNATYRKKLYANNANPWWLRSPSKGGSVASNMTAVVSLAGNLSTEINNTTRGVSPCFCLAPQPHEAPDFSTASWSDIQDYIDEYGTGRYEYQIGATRSITLSNNTTHTLRLSNATGNLYELADGSAYTGMVVEFADIIGGYSWVQFKSSNNNSGALGAIDPMGTTTLPAILALLPQDLQDILPTVKVVRANGGTATTLASSDMKLFIPAYREILPNASSTGVPEVEFNATTSWKYYVLGGKPAKKVNGAGDNADWWLRSPYNGNTSYQWYYARGNSGDIRAINSASGISPAFCLAPTPSAPTPTPTSFADDDWATIKYAVDNNLASAVYSVGDTKTITLSDDSVHTLRIANMTGNLYEYANNAGTYTGFVVEFMDSCQVSAFASNGANSGALATIAPMGTTVLPAIKAKLPSDLQAVLASVKVIKATNSIDGTLASSDMDFFLPAYKEIYGNSWAGTRVEADALTQWSYYTTHSTEADRTKDCGSSTGYWTRSPSAQQNNSQIVYVASNGSYYGEAWVNSQTRAVCPCFCLAPQNTTPVPTPTSFADDDWATIKYAVDNNLASAVYSVGDTKTITLSDNTTHTLRIANMTGNLYEYADNAGSYTGFVVEFVDCVRTGAFGSIKQDYDMTSIEALIPNDIMSIISSVNVPRESGTSSSSNTLVFENNRKLFLPSGKELTTYNSRLRTVERNNVTTWTYYQNNDTDSARIKMYEGSATTYWTRSPHINSSNSMIAIISDGSLDFSLYYNSNAVSPCFCI
ncbi:MAG: hypothetical protein IJI47_03435 [Eubacterium sp.]|nr:hypothetical protein [Eubacterium sp.]